MWIEDILEQFFSSDIVDFSFTHFKQMAPVHYWLKKMWDSRQPAYLKQYIVFMLYF